MYVNLFENEIQYRKTKKMYFYVLTILRDLKVFVYICDYGPLTFQRRTKDRCLI